MGENPVLVLTQPFDPTVDYVIRELDRRGIPVARIDTGQFPSQLTLTARLDDAQWRTHLSGTDRTLDLATVRSVYYRRPSPFTFPQEMPEEERMWAIREARAGFAGLLSMLPRWLNHPLAISNADRKPVQLLHARRCGLDVPKTLITNDPQAARDFVREVGQAVYKTMAQPAIVTADGEPKLIYTTPITAMDIDESVAQTAHMFQEQLRKKYEVRLTVVDRQHFAVRIDAASPAATLDWRADYANLGYTALPQTPPPVNVAVNALLKFLGLRFAALDFAITHDDRWYFLDLNANGQWAWIQDATGQPIAAAIAESLATSSNMISP